MIRVYNTLTKTKEDFEPLQAGKVGIYLCGPTVYAQSHIGHMVGPVIFDSIKRYLQYSGYDVTWVVNITDVDDKLIVKSREQGISMEQLATEMTADYLTNLESLGVDQIDVMPRATEHMQHIIAFIENLVDQGFAYDVDGDVFFEVEKDKNYGQLSNRTLDGTQGEGGEAAARKRSANDFALWKSAKPEEPSWDSPWGAGRPGWHIECSAMSREILGEEFDIHGGGLDLVFPHHENELTQSSCCHGKPMVKYWMHNGLMRAGGDDGKVGGRVEHNGSGDEQATVETKISRSRGAGGLADLIDRQGGQRIRFFLLKSHYRSTIVFSEAGIEETGKALTAFERLFERFQRISGSSFFQLPIADNKSTGDFDAGECEFLLQVQNHRAQYLAKMDDDFNTGGAISDLFDLIRSINRFIDQAALESTDNADATNVDNLKQAMLTMRELTALLGIFMSEQTEDNTMDENQGLTEQLMQLMLALREEARANKDFATADRIRDGLLEMGITIEDRAGGAQWHK
jgi:cysteinyl-tRNA synthetase